MGAVIGGGTRAIFGVGFDDEAREIGDRGVNLINFLAPPFGDAWIGRIESVEAADGFRAGEID